MKLMKFLVVGILFGIVMTKSEAVSWFRIQEMFRFHSFHMYGIIGTAVVLGALLTYLLKKSKAKTLDGNTMQLSDKPKTYKASIIGGFIFGLGWAMTGACPGPLYVLIGHQIGVVWLIIFSALLGTYTYARLQKKLPH